MKCQILYSGKSEDNISFLSTEFDHRVVKVKVRQCTSTYSFWPIMHLNVGFC